MKKTLFFILFSLIFSIGFAQTAVNFNCDDCLGVNHDLFSELDAGKVIVICWVMPCGSCVVPSLTTYNVVQSFQTSNPDKVFMYLVDDYANTSCSSLKSWGNNQGMTDVTCFSNSAIKMSDYGSSGMPKVVVVGDASHTVFYNANNSVNGTALQTAIGAAIAATLTGMDESKDTFAETEFYPNPSTESSSLKFELESSSTVSLKILSNLGEMVQELSYPNLPQGSNLIEINTSGLSNGIYFIKISDGTLTKTIKVVINH